MADISIGAWAPCSAAGDCAGWTGDATCCAGGGDAASIWPGYAGVVVSVLCSISTMLLDMIFSGSPTRCDARQEQRLFIYLTLSTWPQQRTTPVRKHLGNPVKFCLQRPSREWPTRLNHSSAGWHSMGTELLGRPAIRQAHPSRGNDCLPGGGYEMPGNALDPCRGPSALRSLVQKLC